MRRCKQQGQAAVLEETLMDENNLNNHSGYLKVSSVELEAHGLPLLSPFSIISFVL